MRSSLDAAKEFRKNLVDEKEAYEKNVSKLTDALERAKKIGSEAYKRRLSSPKDITSAYIMKKK